MWLGVLGPLVISDGAAAIAVPAAKQRAVLAVLLVNANRVVPADELSDIVWDGAPPAAARVTLRGLIRRLRLLLGPAVGSRIATRPHGYEAGFGADELDLLRFDQLCRDGEAALRAGSWSRCSQVLGQALGLWRDAPLRDVPCQRLQREEAPRLEQARLQAAEWQAEAELCLGHYDRLVPQLQRLVAEQPLRERFCAQLMIALARSGRQAEAQAAYRHARQTLIDELGVEPGPQLQDLHQRILKQDPNLLRSPLAPAAGLAEPAPAAAPNPRQLPTATRHFVGRADELKTLTALLDETATDGPAVVIAAISGMAGVGKTALALRFAHQAADRFGDGQLYVNLRGFDPTGTPADPAEAIRGFLDALGVPLGHIPPTPAAQESLYRSVLAGKQMLIVLDNARDEQQVRPLLPASPASLVIVTSRNQLSGLAAAEGASLLTLDILNSTEATDLLASRLGRAGANAESGTLTEIADLCACLPLALAVAAARAAARPSFPLTSLAAELRTSATRLDALDSGDPAASVRAVFSWSYQQLTPDTARMFRLLGLHPGPDTSAPAAASLTGLPLAQARLALGELSRAHLITEHIPGRYAFHDLLRAYATSQARTTDTQLGRRQAISRILDHYLHTAHTACRLIHASRDPITIPPARPGVTPEHPADHQQALAWLQAEYQVLLAAITSAAENGFDSYAWQIPKAMAEFMDRRGHWHEKAAIQRIAMAATERLGDTAGQAMSVRGLAQACERLGDHDQAIAHCAASLKLYQQNGDRYGEARVHQLLGVAAESQGRYADALSHSEQSLRLYQATGNRPGEAETLNNVGYQHALLGDYQQASRYSRQALTLTAELGFRDVEAFAWDSLGYAEHHLGNLAEAVACYQRSLNLFREYGNLPMEAAILTHLGDTRHACGELRQARKAWQQALDILEDLRDPDAGRVRAKLAAADAAI